MIFTLHRYKDSKEILINSDYFVYAEKFSDYLEVVLLSDECIQVRESMSDLMDLLNGKCIKKKDRISSDICKNKTVKRFKHRPKIANIIAK